MALSVRGLGKCYQIYDKPRHRLKQALWPGERMFYREFWALRDVSFEVPRGAIVGVIGRNGSGKSTLLQLVANTLNPTEGDIEVNGRVSALLELGAGFNPEFSGRENVFLNGAIMGLSKEEMARRYDEIVAFSEIAPFIDQPVKTYSSGMFVRLAFAVAASLDPDILIVDEALSVGDVRFQRKCFRKLEELKSRGTTILFVTHSTELVLSHCTSAVCLEGGRMIAIGTPRDVVHAYLDALFGADGDRGAEAGDAAPVDEGAQRRAALTDGCRARRSYNPEEFRWGDGRAAIVDYQLQCDDRRDVTTCRSNAVVDLAVDVVFLEALEDVIFGLTVKTIEGLTVYASNTELMGIRVPPRAAGDRARVHFRFHTRLLPGDYFISLGVAVPDAEQGTRAVDRRYDLIHLHVSDVFQAFGVADLDMSISVDPG